MSTTNFIRGLWITRCLLCTENMQWIPKALYDAGHIVKKFTDKGLPDKPRGLLYDLGIDSEMELLMSEWVVKRGNIGYILSLLSIDIMNELCVAIISFDECGDVFCVGGDETTDNSCFIVDAKNGNYQMIKSVDNAITNSDELARAMFVKLKHQRIERAGRCRSRKRIKIDK